MNLEHIAHGYLCHRDAGNLYIMGRVCEWEGYEYQEGDIFLPCLEGIVVPQELMDAVIAGQFKGRLVPYNMTREPFLIDETELRSFNPATHRITIKDIS